MSKNDFVLIEKKEIQFLKDRCLGKKECPADVQIEVLVWCNLRLEEKKENAFKLSQEDLDLKFLNDSLNYDYSKGTLKGLAYGAIASIVFLVFYFLYF